ncbi:MAG: hypothetical protein NTV34_16615 [Proteobacteria bacterium]|nr:hypothetical protein [Pseudomonadota bacterium]
MTNDTILPQNAFHVVTLYQKHFIGELPQRMGEILAPGKIFEMLRFLRIPALARSTGLNPVDPDALWLMLPLVILSANDFK